MTDIEVLQRIKEEDPRIVTQLYKQYLNEIVSYLQSKFPSFRKPDAEDIFVKSFDIFCGNIKQGKNKNKPGSIKSYIYGICWHLAYDETKRRDRATGKTTVIDIPISGGPDPDFEEIDKKELLLTQTVWQLTDPCKTLLTLFWYKEKSDKEILELTDYKDTDTVKTQRSRCMKALREKYLTELVNENVITISEKKRLMGK
jgi:DNA-directed RNA polymerase specialized sigma24 family protein